MMVIVFTVSLQTGTMSDSLYQQCNYIIIMYVRRQLRRGFCTKVLHYTYRLSLHSLSVVPKMYPILCFLRPTLHPLLPLLHPLFHRKFVGNYECGSLVVCFPKCQIKNSPKFLIHMVISYQIAQFNKSVYIVRVV